jgi:hypothetical protein
LILQETAIHLVCLDISLISNTMLTPHTDKSIPQVFILFKIFIGELERGAYFCKDVLEKFTEDRPVDASCLSELSHIQVPVQDIQESGVAPVFQYSFR